MARGPSARAHQKVLDAALELVSAGGVAATSMDAIARASGVSKATIYKHWPDKDALLLELLARVHGLHERPVFDSGDVRADVVSVLSYQPEGDREFRERITLQFGAYSTNNPEFGKAWRDLVMDPPRRELRHLLELGVKRGELAEDLDIEFSLTMLLGPVLYVHIFLRQKLDKEVDGGVVGRRQLAERIVEMFWRAYGKKSRSAGGRVRQAVR